MDEDCGNGNELKNTVRHLEESLEKDREECGRPLELGSMSPEQVIQEKQSIQRALNQFKVCFAFHKGQIYLPLTDGSSFKCVFKRFI